MGNKYHVNSKGVPAVCKATKGKCPFGGADSHYDSIEVAQKAADEKNKKEFELFVGQDEITSSEPKNVQTNSEKDGLRTSKKSVAHSMTTEQDKTYVNKRLSIIETDAKKEGGQSYFLRFNSSERLTDYTPNGEKTLHFKEERAAREEIIKNQVGEGNVIGYYKVNHVVKDNKYGNQIFEVRDNWQVRIYDENDGKLVTTFIPTKQRLEIIMLSAGDVPDKEWLGQISKEKRTFDAEWAKVEHLYKKPKTRQSRFSRDHVKKAKEKPVRSIANAQSNKTPIKAKPSHPTETISIRTEKPKVGAQQGAHQGNKQSRKPKAESKEPKYNKNGIRIN